MAGKASTRAKNKYAAKAYESLRVFVPVGKKTFVEQAASDADMSVNAYTNSALLDKMGASSWDEVKRGNEDAGIE